MPRLTVILGPTGVGKSELGLELARRWGAEIVNADALQVYRGLDIGTAKPSPEARRQVRHHLIDILEPAERFSAGRFARLAREAIDEIASRGREAILVGGSGLYLRALLEGLAEIPEVPEAIRRGLERRLAREGLAALRRELERVDPASAERIAAGDPQRTLRALEVAEATGVPLSAWWRGRDGAAQEGSLFGLTLSRAVLYDRLAGRVRRMVDAGWVDEVDRLLAAGVPPSCPAFQAIGYRELVAYRVGRWDLEAAIARIVRQTRRYAKRQMTWFRRVAGITWIEAAALRDRVVAVEASLAGRPASVQ